MRTLLLSLPLCLLAFEAGALPTDIDHYQPAALNEVAMQYLNDGDVDTAMILLERAAVISPQDEVIAANLVEVRQLAGAPQRLVRMVKRVAEPMIASSPEVQVPAASPENLPLPPLWPAVPAQK